MKQILHFLFRVCLQKEFQSKSFYLLILFIIIIYQLENLLFKLNIESYYNTNVKFGFAVRDINGLIL